MHLKISLMLGLIEDNWILSFSSAFNLLLDDDVLVEECEKF